MAKGTRFANIMKKMSRPKGLPLHKRLKEWTLFVGGIPPQPYNTDRVQITSETIEKGKQGKIKNIDHKNNRLYVEDCFTGTKSVKKDAFNPQGGKIMVEKPVSYKDVRIVDPVSNSPTDVEWVSVKDELSGLMKRMRIALVSGKEIPLPKRISPFAHQKDGLFDTPLEEVNKVTWEPNLLINPFPAKLWNQFAKLRPSNRENQLL